MKPLRDCLDKTVGKLLTKEDADALVIAARALQKAGGMNEFAAEQQAVRNALQEAEQTGASVLDQIQTMRPQAHAQAVEFWNRETIRKRAQGVPPPLPRFVTEAGREVPTPTPVSETPAEAPRAPVEAAVLEAPPAAAAPEPVAAPAPAAPPEIPAAPISDAAQEVVNSLPEEQRNAAQKAFSRDDRDPMADYLRSKGQPVEKRRGKPIAPEKNKGLLAELSKYGAFDKPVTEVLQNIANDPKQPRWVRFLTDLLVQLGLGEGVDIRLVNTPNAIWPALYNFNKETGRGEVYINLSYKGDLARRLLHELVHHGTLKKLTDRESNLTPAELVAKRALQNMFDLVRKRREFEGTYGATALREFASEVFANDNLRRKLNSIRPDGKVSLLQRFGDAVLDLLIGDLPVRRGSLLEASIREVLNVAGVPRVETSPNATAAMQEKRSRAARLANAFPGLEEQIADTIAPMAAEHNMGITKAEQKPRVTGEMDPAVAFYTKEERDILEPMIDAQAPKLKIPATKAEIAQVKKRLEIYIKDVRNQNPPEAGWAHDEIEPRRVVLLRGKEGLLFDTTKLFKPAPYTFTKDDGGKNIPRFLNKQLKADIEAGKPLIVNPEWTARRAELGDAMYNEMLQMMDRTDPRRDIILEQINWYRDMIAHLRTTFGSMSDYMADVIAGFSPQNAVKANWLDMIDYFGGVMSGKYDKIFSEFDKYVLEDPENHTATTWKELGKPMPRKISNDALFGANTANALMAGLDLWRQVKFDTAPKARNFGLNLIGLSVRATIDRWAARFLQRMHNPNWRLPPLIEGEVTGKHMRDVGFVAGDFGMGQDVFADVAQRLQESGTPEFANLTPSDLQAVLWFAEKEYWEMRSWTPIAGAGSSMKAVAEGTSAQRYEAGLKPEATPEKKMAGETAKFRAELHKDKSVIGGKVTPTVSLYKSKQLPTIDADWVVKPDYDPTKSVADLAKTAASLGRDAAHVSRVILDPNEDNSNATPGLHIFFKGRVSEKEIQPVLDQLKKAGLDDGVIFSVDPRVRPEIIKSLDPKVDPNQYSGVRIQRIPQYGTTGEIDSNKLKEILVDVANKARGDANIADARVLYYDTLVLEKDTDYDTKGNITPDAGNDRAQAWTGRALRAGSEAATRRDRARDEIANREKLANALQRRNARDEQARLDEFEAAAAAIQPADRANDGGVDPPTVAAMQYEDQQQPVRDPHGGRTSLVRAMVNALTGASRDQGGIEIPQSEQEVRGVTDLGGGANQGRKGSAPLWRPLGETFRKREASLYSKIDGAARLIAATNPEDADNPKDPARYQNSQRLLDLLSGKESLEPIRYVQSGQSRSGGDVAVTVDITKLDAAHAKAQPDMHVGPEGGGGIKGRYQRFAEWLKEGKPVEMPEMNFDWAGRLQFINGRHRFAVLRDKGQRTIDVAVPPDQVVKFREALGGVTEAIDPELKAEITELRKEIPVIPQAQFKGLRHLDSGAEADVYHDPDSGVVYKFFPIKDGKLDGSYVPGQIRLDRGGGIRIGMGEKPTVTDLLSRMERANSHGTITPHELTAITPDGQLVFASPLVEGREVTQKNLPAALARAGVHYLSDLGATSGIAKLDDGRWVVYDDLHPGNVRTMPGGRVEIIDANNRELDQYEIDDLTTLGKMPLEKPPGPPKATRATKKSQNYANATVVAPMVETHHGTPHEWAPEKKVRLSDGTVEWMAMDHPTPSGAVVVERAPAGRVRAEKVASGEGNAAFGWGVLYSAAKRELAESYRKTLTEGQDVRSFISDIIPGLHNRFKQAPNRTTVVDELRQYSETKELVNYPDIVDLITKAASGYDRKSDTYTPEALTALKQMDKLLPSAPRGNVYTVQLDVDDPELLDWFKPMADQMFVWDKVAARFNVTRESAKEAWLENDRLATEAERLAEAQKSEVWEKGTVALKSERYAQLEKEHAAAEERWNKHYRQAATELGQVLSVIERGPGQWGGNPYDGEKFYRFMAERLMKSPRAASEYLNLAGVPGIVFLDQQSRKVSKFEFDIVEGGQRRTLGYNTLEAAESVREDTLKSYPDTVVSEIRKGETTNNYVMFDPERIKVVAKNGQVVHTVAEDLPAPPAQPVVEPVTVAAMAEGEVKDGTDLTVAPMAGTGRRKRKDVSVENYKPAGWTAPFKRLSWEAVKFAQQKSQKEAATVYRVQTMVKDFERAVKKAYKGKPSPEENKNIMLALGNLDNRLTQEQAQEAMKLKGAEREGFLHTAHMENVARFKQQQEKVLNLLPDEIREAVNMLRETLDLEAKETLKDTGLDTELRARLDANQGVFLHSNAFQHFEDDAWGKRFEKSDDSEAQRIRRAAENLFRNEIIGENALTYQKEQKAKGIDVTDEDALRFAGLSGDLDQQIKTRLDDYLNKQADEPSRLHMLMGKMPVARNDAGKMLSLDRENIPKEIRELWGQYDDPATNFSKTLSILANHNAQTRMQNSMLEDGLEKGYFWKQDVSPGPRPPGLVRMSADLRGPMAGVSGPLELKEALSLMNQRPVRSIMSELNSVPLMMKTVGSVASAVRNFFGNPLFMVSNGNLPMSAMYWKKAFWLSLQRAADSLAKPEGRKELARMIELGVLDENVDSNILKRIAKNAGVAQKWESQAGFASSVGAMQRSFTQRAQAVRAAIATPFQRVYTMADNFWRLANYNVELARQKWMNPGLSLEQQEENAAEITRKTLPTYSNIPEGFRESYGKFRDVAAPYLAFQAEAVRTYASSWALAARELRSSNPKERVSGAWRLLGLMAATSAPIALGMASKAMFGYDDDDEKAIRAGLPEYKRNNMLFFLPRDSENAPRYLDLNFMNPYSMVSTAATAAWRGEGAAAVGKQLTTPLTSAQPAAALIMEQLTGRDRLGREIYDPYASWDQQALSRVKRLGGYYVPGTATSVFRIAEAHAGTDIFGSREKTGEALEPLQEWMKVFPGAAIETLDRDKAMEMHVNEHKKAARNASGLFDKKISADGPIGEGEVAGVTKEADERRYRAFQEMRKAYKGLTDDLGMKPADAIKQMRIGFGSEIRKGGLSKDIIKQIVTGNYQRFEPSKQLLKETAFKDRERDHKRLPEFKKAQQQLPPSRTASP